MATGLAKARDIKGDKENIIAIIGDGSLSGGEALEGLNVAGSEINSNLIIIVNDNEQSIAEVHGGMYKNLAELRETGGTASNNLYKAFGLDYIYEENGNDIASLISLFRKVKDTDHPIVSISIHKKERDMRLLKKTKRDGIGVCHLTVKQANLQFLLEMEKIIHLSLLSILCKKQKVILSFL